MRDGGTHTFKCPEGDQSIACEVEGNKHAKFTAECCMALYDAGREFLVKSSAPDGRYPKLWDLAAIVELRKRTGARVVPMHMCEWGLQLPTDVPDLCRTSAWWLVSPRLHPYASALAHRRHSKHKHATMEGATSARVSVEQAISCATNPCAAEVILELLTSARAG